MKHKKILAILVIAISLLALIAAGTGIFSRGGPGRSEFVTVHGQMVVLYGEGLYRNMSVETARDGIAQDIITIILAVPMLVFSFIKAKNGSLKAKFILSGTLLYFLFTYLLYSVMAMYNEMLLAYIILASTSFFAFVLMLINIWKVDIAERFKKNTPVRFTGSYLIVLPLFVALMWLSRIISALVTGSVPVELEHYTTTPVQILDLAFMHPASILTGILLITRRSWGYLFAPIISTFLLIMMTAIAAKGVGQLFIIKSEALPIVIIFSLSSILALVCVRQLTSNIVVQPQSK